MIDIASTAARLRDAYTARRTDVAPPSSEDSSFDLDAAYAIEAELATVDGLPVADVTAQTSE